MEKIIAAIKEFLKLNARDRLVAALIVGNLIFYYMWMRAEGKADGKDIENKNMHKDFNQLQREKESQAIAFKQEVFDVKVKDDIECEKEKQEIHKSYAESAKQYEKMFKKNR